MENRNRNVFGLNGVTGMLIATVLLLTILVVLTILGIKAQQDVVSKPYVLKDVNQVKMYTDIDTAKKTMQVKE